MFYWGKCKNMGQPHDKELTHVIQKYKTPGAIHMMEYHDIADIGQSLMFRPIESLQLSIE